jgi:DNA mismatch repair protein MutS2
MDAKTLQVLEYPKVLERLAACTSFSASTELARALKPSTRWETVVERQKTTSEARLLLSLHAENSIGGSTDIRPLTDLAARGGVLNPVELMQVKSTLEAARELGRYFEKNQVKFPLLAAIAAPLAPPPGLIEAISRCINERSEIRDSASPKLATIRRELKTAYDRLMGKLQKMITDPRITPILQEAIITQRGGRFVIPLRADFKGRMRVIVHDQSSSGATLFVEPLATVDLNNEWQEKQLAERDEERRILTELSAEVGVHAAALNALLIALAELDLALASAKYAEDLHASEPLIPEARKAKGGKHPGSSLQLYHARHPLLDPEKVVPIDFDLDEDTFAVVITGPNTGGKTVSLKTVGLLTLMAQSGLHIPAQSGSAISCFHQVFADIGDEQSIEQSLSTFSGHITNIVRILRMADRDTLVILDELGAGTDPQEGSAIARAILGNLVERAIPCLVATHYPELKAFAHTTPGVTNASVEFDLKTLRPTYHLSLGLPGRSNALAIAERLGLSYEIITSARAMLDPGDLKAEDLLDEIHRQRDLARTARAEAEEARQKAIAAQREWETRLQSIEAERAALLDTARGEARQEAEDLHAELDSIRRELTRARQPIEGVKSLQQELERIEQEIPEPEPLPQPAQVRKAGPLKVGEKVHLRTLKADGVITSLGEEELEVQVGAMHIRARREDIQRKTSQPGEVEKPAPAGKVSTLIHPSPGLELDLRGQTAEEALPKLEDYLDDAYLAGMPYVRIIHGKGTGKLRETIRAELRKSPHVSSWVRGHESEGGDGVTVVKFNYED